MEKYAGAKFHWNKTGNSFDYDERLGQLNAWAFILAELGLTPIHSEGAYGNQSYFVDPGSLIITKSGMVPDRHLRVENYVFIEKYDRKSEKFFAKGVSAPSSESFLHFLIYTKFQNVGSIMHGHSRLLEQHAHELGIPVTSSFLPYGTIELAESALQLFEERVDFILLKEHGFVAVGPDIDATGKLVLQHYARLVDLLRRM